MPKTSSGLIKKFDIKKYFCYHRFVEDLICDVTHELAYAKKEYLNIKAADFNIEYILMEQREKKNKFKEKIKGD